MDTGSTSKRWSHADAPLQRLDGALELSVAPVAALTVARAIAGRPEALQQPERPDVALVRRALEQRLLARAARIPELDRHPKRWGGAVADLGLAQDLVRALCAP